MRIAVVLPNLNIAGAQVMVVNLLSELVKTDNKFTLVILHEPQNNYLTRMTKQMGISIKYLPCENTRTIGLKIQAYLKLQKIFLHWEPDIIHANLEYRYTWLYSLVHRTVIIETIHSQPYRIRNRLTSVMYQLLKSKKLIYPVLITKSNADEFQQLFRGSRNNTTIIPNAIKIEKYVVSDRVYSAENIKFVYVARFEEIKNHDMLIRAFSIAEKIVPNIRLKLVGDGSLIEEEKQFVRHLGIDKKVDFMGQRNDVADILKECDVGVISSKSEACSVALMEYMASGLPVIVTAVGGMRDIVDSNGYLIDKDDEKAFANAMIQLATDERKRKKMGEISVELARRYDIRCIVNQYVDLYRSVQRDVRK